VNITEITFNFEVARWLVTTAVGVYAWLIGRQSASAKEMLELRTRLTKLEVEMTQVPNQTHMQELVGQVQRMVGSVETLGARIDPLTRSVDRMENYLLNQK